MDERPWGATFVASGVRRGQRRYLQGVVAAAERLREAGWAFDPFVSGAITVFDSAAWSRDDVFGLFEAPSSRSLELGLEELERAGWHALFEGTTWSIGPRDEPPRGSIEQPHSWAFLAFWDWNDGWHLATPDEKATYDKECEVAFHFDLASGVAISGRYDLAACGGPDQVAMWNLPSIETLAATMGAHEAQHDFKFTWSDHLLGRRTPLRTLGGRA